MKLRTLLLCAPVLIAVTEVASAADELPRVLILGDVIYQQPARDAAKALQGRATVVFPAIQPGQVRNSQTTLPDLDTLLGNEEWDLIHFNFGLGDLVYRAPNMKSFRIMPVDAGGVRAVSPEEYEDNLQKIVARLKSTGAKLVWASTTPIRHSSTRVFQMESEVKYNAIAAEVMAAHNVPINDMYTFVRNLIDMKRPAGHGADPFFFDRKPLHPPIASSIEKHLKLPKSASKEQD